MARHSLTHADEIKGGEHSHSHHHKMIKHHLGELAKMAKHGSKHHSSHHSKSHHAEHEHKGHHGKHEHHHVTAHDKAVDRKNLSKARHAR